ncbi:MAG: sn-glycerol-3-phosphate ABC transporter ATP-binding protein UgpC [Clostridiales bacterium]|nr:sn-glycerol-3-phosphate ABC transporter ATP-binding protein UgpC [Clostridiales bacterium]
MANLSLKHIYKVYPNGAKAVNDFNMEIADKEFIVFVGPSGCGKSTTLRMIAGLEDITAGELKIGETVVNDIEPKDRDIAMVFQNYALYPHMTVYENIAFGLRLKKIPKDIIHKRVIEAAEILHLTEYLGRKPKEMSGGQRQRVSLGRAIVREPKVMLLDEPLSNLDAKLRTQMRAEISKLHTRLNTTFIYVTHDQVEAMTMGTRIVVMKGGCVQQIDTPKNLYCYPKNKFVAGFMGTPQMNFFEGTLLKKGEEVEVTFAYSDQKITVPYSLFYKVKPSYLNGDCPVYIGLRAEDITLEEHKVQKSLTTVNIKISHLEELGAETLVYGDLNMGGDGYVESSTRCIVKLNTDMSQSPKIKFTSGEVVKVALNMQKAHLFDKVTEQSILPKIPQNNYLDCTVEQGKLIFCGEELALPPAINCPNLYGDLIIPTNAFYLGGSIKAKVLSCERIDSNYLTALKIGDRILYASNLQVENASFINLGVDCKKITVLSQGKQVISPLPQTVCLYGKLIKQKQKVSLRVKGKIKSKNQIVFRLEIEGAQFEVSDYITKKLISVLGAKKAFTTPLRFECNISDITFANEGIKAKVLNLLDYGRQKFAKVAVGEKQFFVAENGQGLKDAHLLINLNSASVYQADLNVKIV